MCRHLFDDIYRKNGSRLPPRLTPLPADLQAAILSKLTAEDLAKVECTCTELRDLVAGRELWRAKYMAARWWFLYSSERLEIDNSSRSWKEKYMAARRRWPLPWPWPLMSPAPWRCFLDNELEFHLLLHRTDWRRRLRRWRWLYGLSVSWPRFRQDPTEHLVQRFRQRRRKVPVGGGDGHRWTTAMYGSSERRCREGAIHSPSARYRWTHR
ncbi:hypothetical protein ACP70R_019771 [Stipagrostis hirtigluma subsp. patula]